jgi:hypothetical protein
MAKLTLSVDGEVVGTAKRYAARRGTSISQMVEGYLRLVCGIGEPSGEADPPILARWRGVLKGSGVDESDYRRYLARKYR